MLLLYNQGSEKCFSDAFSWEYYEVSSRHWASQTSGQLSWANRLHWWGCLPWMSCILHFCRMKFMYILDLSFNVVHSLCFYPHLECVSLTWIHLHWIFCHNGCRFSLKSDILLANIRLVTCTRYSLSAC